MQRIDRFLWAEKGPSIPKVQGGTNATVTGNYLQNGRLASSTVYNPKTRTYSENSFLTPQQQQLNEQSTSNLQQLLPQIQSAAAPSAQDKAKYAQELYAPQERTIQRNALDQMNDVQTRFDSAGLGNSAGFGRYAADRVGYNEAGLLSDAQHNATAQAENLGSIRLQPLLQAASLLNGTTQDLNSQYLSNLNPSYTGQQTGFSQRQQLLGDDQQSYNSQIARGTPLSSFLGGLGRGVGTAATAAIL